MKTFNYEYDENCGTTMLTLADKYGRFFIGSAQCHPQDEEFKSETIGRDLAYLRANMEKMKDEIYIAKNEKKTIDNFVKSLVSYKNFDAESETAKCVFRQQNMVQKKIDLIQSDIDTLYWLERQIVNTGCKLDDALINLEDAIERNLI